MDTVIRIFANPEKSTKNLLLRALKRVSEKLFAHAEQTTPTSVDSFKGLL